VYWKGVANMRSPMSSGLRWIVWVQIVSAPGITRSKLKLMRPRSSFTGRRFPTLSQGVAWRIQLRIVPTEAVRIDSGFSWNRCWPAVSGRPIPSARAGVTSDGM